MSETLGSEDPVDVCLRMIADPRRRRVVRYLHTYPADRVAVEDLVAFLGSDEVLAADRPPDRGRVATSLHHSHLPKLDESGLIEYDPERGTVRYRPSEFVDELLAFLSDWRD